MAYKGRTQETRLGNLQLHREEEGEKQEHDIWLTAQARIKDHKCCKLFDEERYFDSRMYTTGTARWPVKHYNAYLAKRPVDMTKPDDPSYLTINKNRRGNIWYQKQPLGIHSPGNFANSLAENTKMIGKCTNHLTRKTSVKILRERNFYLLDISQLSGHKNMRYINNVSTVSEERQKEISIAL